MRSGCLGCRGNFFAIYLLRRNLPTAHDTARRTGELYALGRKKRPWKRPAFQIFPARNPRPTRGTGLAPFRACSESLGPYRQTSQMNELHADVESSFTALAQPASFLPPCQAARSLSAWAWACRHSTRPIGNSLRHPPSPPSPDVSRTPCANGLSVSPPWHGGRAFYPFEAVGRAPVRPRLPFARSPASARIAIKHHGKRLTGIAITQEAFIGMTGQTAVSWRRIGNPGSRPKTACEAPASTASKNPPWTAHGPHYASKVSTKPKAANKSLIRSMAGIRLMTTPPMA